MTRAALRVGLLSLVASLFAVAMPGVVPAADAQPTAAEQPESAKKADVAVPAAKTWVTKHRITVGGAPLAYTATAGTMLITNDKDEPIALFGYTAYTKDGADRATRPLLFAYNGGPGSASAWLHMGILGPKRTKLDDLDANSRGPFRTVENEHTILDRADLVMIDPVGTGFSRVVGKGDGKDFWGVDQDARSVSDFIVRYLNQAKRWASPKYVLGESYGGMRSGAVAYTLLTRHNVALNGVVLVSPYMDFVGGNAGLGIDVANVNFMTTYAATAWYHQAIPNRSADLRAFLREAEAFARDVYAPVLFKGARATPAERRAATEGLARYTGVSAEYWDRANLRLDEGRFLQELLRSKGRVVGRIDSRYTGGTLNAVAEMMKYDPYSARIAPAIVATFNDYYRQELEVESDREYILSGGVWSRWDQSHRRPDVETTVPVANTGVDLAHAMVMNPHMQVLVQQGYFDLACPYGTVEYFVDHMDVPPDVRKNVTIAYYEAGHMMYVHPPSMVKFKQDLAAFVDATSR